MRARAFIILVVALAVGLAVFAAASHGDLTTRICKNPQVIIRDAGTSSTMYPPDC